MSSIRKLSSEAIPPGKAVEARETSKEQKSSKSQSNSSAEVNISPQARQLAQNLANTKTSGAKDGAKPAEEGMEKLVNFYATKIAKAAKKKEAQDSGQPVANDNSVSTKPSKAKEPPSKIRVSA